MSDDIYKDELAIEAFRHFKTLRNKHIVHDENSHHEANVGAILNGGGKPYKIEKIVASSRTAMTLDVDAFRNLQLLVKDALAWVNAKFDETTKQLTEELEQIPHADLLAKEELRWSVPRLEDIAKPRSR